MALHTARSLRYTIFALLLTSRLAWATALTAILNAHERSCYYADVDGVGEKIGASASPFFPAAQEQSLVEPLWRERLT